MLDERFYEDYELGAVRETLARTIGEADIALHAGQTGNFHPHHMDAEWCRTQLFGQRIAHGTLIFSVGVGMAADIVNPRVISYGYDRLRFVRPVFIGDTIRVRVTLKDKREDIKRPRHGIVAEAHGSGESAGEKLCWSANICCLWSGGRSLPPERIQAAFRQRVPNAAGSAALPNGRPLPLCLAAADS